MKLTPSRLTFQPTCFLHAWQGEGLGLDGDEGIHSFSCPIVRREATATHHASEDDPPSQTHAGRVSER